jgi:hypothetical protein
MARYVTSQYLAAEIANLGYSSVAVIGEPGPLHTCPCCGFRTLESPGDYDICPVCYWEDDGNRDPERHSSANHLTLGQARRNFAEYGACCPESESSVDRTPGKYVPEPGRLSGSPAAN